MKELSILMSLSKLPGNKYQYQKKFLLSTPTLEGMENYTRLGKLGEGTYGVVYKVGSSPCQYHWKHLLGDGQSDKAECGAEADSFGKWKWGGAFHSYQVKPIYPSQSYTALVAD